MYKLLTFGKPTKHVSGAYKAHLLKQIWKINKEIRDNLIQICNNRKKVSNAQQLKQATQNCKKETQGYIKLKKIKNLLH